MAEEEEGTITMQSNFSEGCLVVGDASKFSDCLSINSLLCVNGGRRTMSWAETKHFNKKNIVNFNKR